MPRVRSSLTASEFLAMRHALGLSQVQAGKLLGYTDRTVKRWEAGQPIPEHVCIMMRLMRGNRASALALGAKPPPVSIHEKLKAAGVPLDHHATDLYAMKTPVSQVIVDAYQFRDQVTEFKDQRSGGIWFEIPFAYDDCRETAQ
jgi:DNA-binding XRE family transcriptional regulator